MKNKFFTDEFIRLADIVPAQCIKNMHKSLRAVERAWLLICSISGKLRWQRQRAE